MNEFDRDEPDYEDMGQDPEGPKFLDTTDPATYKKPEDTTWGDYMLRPDRPLADKHREVARLLAHGKTNQEICKLLGYTPGRVSILKSNTKIKTEVARYRDRLFAADTKTRLKELESDAINVMGDILIDTDLSVEKKESAAKWVLEKTTGKASQQIDINHEVSLGLFYEELDKLKGRSTLGPSPSPTTLIDVVPTSTLSDPDEGEEEDENLPQEGETTTSDPFDDWLDRNI